MREFMQTAFYAVWIVVGLATLAAYKLYYPMTKTSLKMTEKMMKEFDED